MSVPSSTPGPRNLLTDVAGLLVGNAEDTQARSGVTVLLAPERAVAAVDVRGGAPGTRETDALGPLGLVEALDAVVLAGGSVYGLEAASAVTNWLGARKRGYVLRPEFMPAPIVPAAILFDLANGGDKDWGESPPYGRLGRAACENASADFALGNAGAGYGAIAGRLKGGLGSASVVMEMEGGPLTVAALIVVNAFGSLLAPGGGAFWAAPFAFPGELGTAPEPAAGAANAAHPMRGSKMDAGAVPGGNTTIGIVATDAELTPLQALRVAIMAQDGLARAIRPIHTPFDGDTIFALATAKRKGAIGARDVAIIGTLAADCAARAAARGVYEAQSLAGLASYRELFGS